MRAFTNIPLISFKIFVEIQILPNCEIFSSHVNKLEAPVICKTTAKRSIVPNLETITKYCLSLKPEGQKPCMRTWKMGEASNTTKGLVPLVG